MATETHEFTGVWTSTDGGPYFTVGDLFHFIVQYDGSTPYADSYSHHLAWPWSARVGALGAGLSSFSPDAPILSGGLLKEFADNHVDTRYAEYFAADMGAGDGPLRFSSYSGSGSGFFQYYDNPTASYYRSTFNIVSHKYNGQLVPEPATWAMLFVGIVIVFAARKRQVSQLQ
jgi:hypothetical protein